MKHPPRNKDKIIDDVHQINSFQESLDYVAKKNPSFRAVFNDQSKLIGHYRRQLSNIDKDQDLQFSNFYENTRIIYDLVIKIDNLFYGYYLASYSDNDFIQEIISYKNIGKKTLSKLASLISSNSIDYTKLLNIWQEFLNDLGSYQFLPIKKRKTRFSLSFLWSSYESLSITTFLIGILIFLLFVIFGVVK